jgi:transcriptional regulator with XRE-family HTH domain
MAYTLFTEWLQAELDQRGWSPAELARRMGSHRSVIYNILNNNRNAGADVCYSIATALGVSAETVFRAAGLLPPAIPDKDEWEDLKTLMQQLSPEGQRRLLEQARLELRLQDQLTAKKRPGGTGELRAKP